MSAPTETAAEALSPYVTYGMYAPSAAQRALASLAQHRDDIARVIQSCDANSEPWDDLHGYAREAFRRRADAVLAYLTGEVS